MRSMKKLIVLTALVAGIGLAQQANACEWMKQAAKPATVVTCEDGTCTAEQTQAEAATTETAPAAPQNVEEPAPASPTVVASEH
jgi:phage portal protein BeeE